MSDSEDEMAASWVPYAQRPEWSDVTRLEQDDGPNPVVRINYSNNFKDVYDYFRAIVAKNEKSERALALTQDALRLNAANYTVWQYRRDILISMGKDLYEELKYVESVIDESPKNYQVWHHRRLIVETLNDPAQELRLTEQVLASDSKNYHAWQHRQWALRAFNLFENELAFVDKLLGEDVRNNSAWNQRFFVLQHTGLSPEVLERELNYVTNRIELVKNNESAWNFLRGILQHNGHKLHENELAKTFAEDLYAEGCCSPYLIAFLIDVYRETIFDTDDFEENVEDLIELSEKVNRMLNSMRDHYDKIRWKYWRYVQDKFRVDFEKMIRE